MDIPSDIESRNMFSTRSTTGLNNSMKALRSRVGELHLYNFIFMAILLIILKAKVSAAGSESPFVTHHFTMVTFVVTVTIHTAASALAMTMQTPKQELVQCMINISFMSGSLGSILIVSVFLHSFGLVAICVWFVYFLRGILTDESYVKTLDYLWDKVKEFLKSSNQTQEQNGDQNEMENLVVRQDAGQE